MLSVFFLLLHKFSEDEDIIVGFPVAGRDHAGIEDVLGLFMNLVCVRVRFGELRTLSDIIGAVKRKSSDALKYGRYPFDQLVSKVNPLRDVGRSSIFTAMFQYYDHSQENDDSVLHDISFLCKEAENGLRIRIEYSASLFKRETIETYFSALEQLIARLCTEEDQPLHQILKDESSRLGASIQLSPLIGDNDRDVVRAFREQCRRTPDAVAVRAGDASLTYRELDARSNQIAWLLSREGVGTDCRVGIMTGRNEHLPIALLGILKSGAAYVPRRR
jgi:iturin family lipopeptide synthetase A